MKKKPSETFAKIIDARLKLACRLKLIRPDLPSWKIKIIVNTNTPLKPIMQIIMLMKKLEQTCPLTNSISEVYECLAKQIYWYFYLAPIQNPVGNKVQEDLCMRFLRKITSDVPIREIEVAQ